MWFRQFFSKTLLFLTPYAICLVVGAVLLSLYTKDLLLLAVNSRYSSAADVFFKYMTHVGDGNMYMLLAVLVLLFVSKYKALLMVTSYAISSLPVQLIKNYAFTDNHRPKAYFWNDSHRLHFTDGVEILVSNSFPSGHTAAAFSMFLLISYFTSNRILSVFFFILAFLTGYSRMYLAQHFFADVYAGSFLGVSITILVAYYFEHHLGLHQKEFLKDGLLTKK